LREVAQAVFTIPNLKFRVSLLRRLNKHHIKCWYKIWYKEAMPASRKITVEISETLLEKAQLASGSGITGTVRTGLELLAASQAYKRLRQLRGKVRFTRTVAELKVDR
jgi:hypothetical protein